MENISEILKRTRESKNLTLRDVSEATKIREPVLKAIEDGNFNYLDQIYMESFTKEYIEYLGLNLSDFQQQLETIFKHKPLSVEENESPIIIAHTKRKFRYTAKQLNTILYFVYGGLFISFLAIIYFTFFYEPEEIKPLETIKTSDTLQVKTSTASETKQTILPQDSIKLEFIAIDTVWINIIIDNRISEKMVLYPNNKKVWKGMNSFRFTLGNAGGVIIRRNDEQLPQLSKERVVIKNVIVTRDKFYVESPAKKAPKPPETPKPVLISPSEIKKEIPSLRDTKKLKKP
jgi:cytoskeletal protein RodZ